ncbi:hypothetical protein [Methylomonas koyamae]|uniref:hypothetical protein n=1 Tax=Methylomonas koyamae TaxID=702114 RepID=UPI001FD33825|nr:hypothetical protein [Methylomonas koyamae]
MLYTTWSPCPICSRAILLYGIPRVVIGENQTFVGEEQLLRQRCVTLEIAQDQRRRFNRLVKNPLIFPLTHGFRDFFVLKSVMTSSFNRFAPVSRAFYSPEAVCGRFSGALRPRWAHSTPVSA